MCVHLCARARARARVCVAYQCWEFLRSNIVHVVLVYQCNTYTISKCKKVMYYVVKHVSSVFSKTAHAHIVRVIYLHGVHIPHCSLNLDQVDAGIMGRAHPPLWESSAFRPAPIASRSNSIAIKGSLGAPRRSRPRAGRSSLEARESRPLNRDSSRRMIRPRAMPAPCWHSAENATPPGDARTPRVAAAQS